MGLGRNKEKKKLMAAGRRGADRGGRAVLAVKAEGLVAGTSSRPPSSDMTAPPAGQGSGGVGIDAAVGGVAREGAFRSLISDGLPAGVQLVGGAEGRTTRIERTLTRLELAEELDLHPETVTRHKAMGAPSERRGKKDFYNAPEYRAWMVSEGLTGDAHRPVDGGSADLEKAKLRKENALAAKYELQVKREQGDLVAVEEVRKWIGQHVSTFRNRLIGLGAAITPLLEGRDAAERQGLIDERVTQCLAELAGSVGGVGSVRT